MNRPELPLFPIMLALSALGHGAAFVLMTGEPIAPPELLPSHPGVASVKLVASEAARPEPSDRLADLPILEEPVNVPLPDPKLTKQTPQPVERPREHEPLPPLASETKLVAPAEVPELTTDLIQRLSTPRETAKTIVPKQQVLERPRTQIEPKLTAEKKIASPAAVPDLLAELTPPAPPKDLLETHDLLKPVAMNRPRTERVEQPALETITKVADRAAKASPASAEVAGAVDDLPQKLPINPPPPYPAAAIAAKQEGTVTLRVMISAEGRVTAGSVYSSSGVPSLDESALSTVLRWVFSPARRGGRAIPYEVLVPIEFSIRRSG